MAHTQVEILEKLVELLKRFNTTELTLDENINISKDLEIDSVTILDFVMEVEDYFDMDISMNDLSEIHTLKDLTKFIHEHLKGRD